MPHERTMHHLHNQSQPGLLQSHEIFLRCFTSYIQPAILLITFGFNNMMINLVKTPFVVFLNQLIS